MSRTRPDGGRRRARAACVFGAVLCAFALALPPAAEARGGGAGSAENVTREQQRAIVNGVAWIAEHQQPGGMWGSEKETRVADTALCLLALMADGNLVVAGRPLEFGSSGEQRTSVPELRGRYAAHVKKGIEYLARLAWDDKDGRKPRGYIHDDEGSRMHGHGFAMLALATAAGGLGGRPSREIRAWLAADTSRDPSGLPLADQVRYALSEAVYCTVHSQDLDTGGWLYEPYQQGHEGSMTVTQIVALRAARDAGLAVNDATLARAYEYVRTSQNRTPGEKFGAFAYQKTDKGRVSYALTAAALTTLYGLGRYGLDKDDSRMIEDGLRYMDRNIDETLDAERWFYYSLFYGAQALYQAQDDKRFTRDWPRIRRAILDHQKSDGSFRARQYDKRSSEYCTAMGVLTLNVPLETLPVFQMR